MLSDAQLAALRTLCDEHRAGCRSPEMEDAAHEGLAALLAERDELRAALGAVEWAGRDVDGKPYCVACDYGAPHEPDCPVGRALGRPECKEARWLTVRLDSDEDWVFLRLAARAPVLCDDGFAYRAQGCRWTDDGAFASYYGERGGEVATDA